MCMSVPQIAVLRIRIRTSLCPTAGSGTSSIQMPGARRDLTSAFMFLPLTFLAADHTELAAHLDAGRDRPVELPDRVPRAHLRADARLAHRHDGVREADDV